jgi:DNA-binding NarL/FixJ family response regulator
VTKRLRAALPGVRVLILSAYDDEDYVMAALSAGASGYLLKTAHMSEVVTALHAVMGGDVVLHGTVAHRVIARARHDTPGRAGILTGRELEVLRLAARGSRTKEIAADLAVSTRTVEAHLTSIFNKLGVSTRTEAVLRASSKGWLSVADDPPLQ